MGWFIAGLLLCVHVWASEGLTLEHEVVREMPPSAALLEEVGSPDGSPSLRFNHLQQYHHPIPTNEAERLDFLGRYLARILLENWESGSSPIVYIESNPPHPDYDDDALKNKPGDEDYDQEARLPPYKRSRYYRKYPWKRQNTRETYEPHNPYICTPSKDDVYRLLVALHGARQGVRGQAVNFCNRKRPAHAIFSHIRFLGKRK